MGKRLVITEKPSVARDIAAALGHFIEDDDVLESEDFVITWAVGHLLELAEPQDYDPAFRSWSIKNLPILPTVFQLKPRDGQKKRLDKMKKLANRKDVTGLVNACDAGREGELIFRRIAEYCEITGMPMERLWLQSMTHAAIREAFDSLRDGHDLDPLADAAWLRSVGDWLVGMNATRALTQRLKSRGEQGAWSAGRVQTPTLFILVAREREILAHIPQPYWEIEASFVHPFGSAAGSAPGDGHAWTGRFYDPALGQSDNEEDDTVQRRPNRIFDRALVDRLVAGLQGKDSGQASEKRKKSKQAPPMLFDLTTLQREANKRFSMSARRTLDAAQRLYEQHKLLTYPRTDSRYLPGDYGPVVDTLLTSISALPPGDYAEHGKIAGNVRTAGPQNLQKILDSSKVSDHFAIIPTGNPVPPLSGDDVRIFDLVLRQFLAALMGPATWATVERFVDVDAGLDKPARFRTTAKSLEVPGFLEALGQLAGAGTQLPPLSPGKDEISGVKVGMTDHTLEDKETRPPGRYSEAQLLRMMETAGEALEEEDLSDAMKDRGLGTPATRADTIERLVSTQYARRVQAKLLPTSKAMRLMDVLERVDAAALASPALTGEWEFALNQVALGKRARDDVRDALVDYTREVTNALTGFEHDTLYSGEKALGKCPQCGSDVVESVWGYRCVKNERDAETRTCEFMIWKDRFGRYIDRTLVERLLLEGTVGPIDGFVDRSGREVLKGTLTLKKDDEKGWILDTKFGMPAAAGEAAEEGEEQIVGPSFPCPEHADCQIIETNFRWVCSKLLDGTEKSGPVLLKKVCLRDIEPEEAAAYFGEAARTSLLEGFTSRRGRPFKGMIIRKPTGKHGFEFPEREPRPGRKGAAPAKEGEDAPAKKAKARAKPKAKGKAKGKAKAKAKPKAAKGGKGKDVEATDGEEKAAKPKAKAKGKGKGVEAEAV